jgi:tetratricopeptide (TPR) repeat protein
MSLFSQIPMVIGTMFGERLAYLPSFWFISGLIFILLKLLKTDLSFPINSLIQAVKAAPAILIGTTIISLAYAFKTIDRNKDWADNYTLFTTDAATYQQSVRLNNGAAEQTLRLASAKGLAESEVNRLLALAEKYCQQIMTIKPVATAYLTLGNIRLKQKKYLEAIQYYDQVNDLKSIVDVNKALAYRELGREAGEKEQNLKKSQEMLSQSLALNEGDAETWFLLGVLYGVSGNHLKAAENFEKAYALKPDEQYAKNVIMAYQNLGNSEKIAEYQKYLTK